MERRRQRVSDVVMDCLALSDGTIATLTGYNRYEDIDRVRAAELAAKEVEQI